MEQDMNRMGTARRLAVAVLGLGVFAAVSAAQPPRRPALDPLAEARARQQIADQKAEMEVLAAIADADRIARTNPAKAVHTLKTAQSNIDLAVALGGDTRKKLTDTLQRKIAALEGRPLPNPGVKPDPAGASVKKDRAAAIESYAAELKDVKEGVERFAKLKQSGLNAQADRELAKLSRAYPNNPSIIRLMDQDTLGARVQDSADFAKLQSDRFLLAMRHADKATLPIGGPHGDIEFPADWKEKTARRLQKVELTAEEKKIIEALDKPVTVNWNGKPLDEAMQELSNLLDQKLFIDKKSVEDLGIDLRKPFTLQANGVSARTVLRQVLASQGLTFVIKDQVIQVVDVERAKNMLVTRVYYLGDVVQGVGPFGDATKWGPFLDFQQTMANVEGIIKTITSSIDPLSWKEKGGPSSITFHPPSMSIIVRASAEVHATLGSKMGGGR
jgi:hypothetical protein